jgi:hypothetical protein
MQDDWHLTPRFTVNLGLRYDIFGAFSSRQQPNTRFCFSCLNSYTGLPGEVQFSGHTPGFPAGSANVPSNYNDLGPRINFSWSPFANNKTVIRGGYDIFYSNEYEAINSIQTYINTPGWADDSYWTGSEDPSQCAPQSSHCVAWELGSTYAKGPLTVPPVPTNWKLPAQEYSQGYGGFMKSVVQPSHDPMIQSWVFQVEQQLPGNLGLTVGYDGNLGTHLLDGAYNYDHIPTSALEKYRESINSVVPITDFYSGNTAQALAQTYGAQDLPISELVTAYPFWPFVDDDQTFAGISEYDALDFRLQKQYSTGLQWNVAYTVSKDMVNPEAAYGALSGLTVDPIHNTRTGYAGGEFGALGLGQPFSVPWQNYSDIAGDRSEAPWDMPQILSIESTYQLPFGKGRRFNLRGLPNAILGGWQLGGMFAAQSGVPLSITGPCDGMTSLATGDCRPNLVGNPTSFSGPRTKAQQIKQWLNPAAFEPVFGNNQSFWASPNVNSNQWWQFATEGMTVTSARSPGFWNLDASLNKDFHVNERDYFELRWEVFNALNHQNLGLPNTHYCLPPGSDGQTNLVQQAGCTFGEITNVQTDPRAMEFALKFNW